MLYLQNISQAEFETAKEMYTNAVKSLILVDASGRHMLSWDSERKAWGRNSDLLGGSLALFKKQLHDLVSESFPNNISWRESHVDVKGNHDVFIYPSLNMMQVSYIVRN